MSKLSSFVALLPFIAFWLWMFREMASNNDLEKGAKLFWLFGFIFLNIPASILYYFVEYRKGD